MTKLPESSASQAENGDEEFLPPTPAQTKYLRRQEHPYAKLSVTLRTESGESHATAIAENVESKATASIKDFDAGCRTVFQQYIPATEKGRLRPHHRNFIARNRTRSPIGRQKILVGLRKYDLSSISGIEAHFNRERDPFTEGKLKEIEQAVDVSE